jgi:hypothetical protein
MLHELKTWPEHFSEIVAGRKNFELRRNDRDFKVGDELLLREYWYQYCNPDGSSKEGYSGRILHRRIDYVLDSYGAVYGVEKGYVILSLSTL